MATVKRGARWFAVISYRDDAGIRKQRWVSGFRTKREAELAEARLLLEREKGVDIAPSRLTLEAYLERWLEYKKPPAIRERTWKNYDSLIRRHVLPVLGSMRLVDVRPSHIGDLHKAARKNGLGEPSVKIVHWLLSGALDQALRWELIGRNPAKTFTLPQTPRREWEPLETPQILNMLKVADQQPIGPIVRLAVATGMRRSELVNLRWDDVDFEDGTLFVRRSKTDAGVRSLSLGPDTLAMLKELRRQQLEWKVAAYSWADSGHAFVHRDGTKFSVGMVQWYWQRIRKDAGLPPGFRFHDLRHTHVSLLIEHGIDLKVIQERVGHSSIKVTADVYGHLKRRADSVAALKVEAVLRGAL